MNRIKLMFASVIAMACVTSTIIATPALVSAAPKDEIQKGIGGANTGGAYFDTIFKSIVNILLFLIGAASVIMIIIGGIKYTTSNGDSSQIKSAKDTILYAIVGIIVAVSAYAIVNFVLQYL